MKPERAFVAQRAAAQHCAELLRAKGPSPDDLRARLAAMAGRLAHALGPALMPFVGGEIEVAALDADNGAALHKAAHGLAANLLFAVGDAGVPVLLTLDAAAVLSLVDRTFGGRGEVAQPLPEKFPLSADLLLARLADAAAAALAEALGLNGEDAVRPIDRNGSLAEPGRAPWQAHLALAEANLPLLMGEQGSEPRRVRGRADPGSEPFAALPLELSAVLVDMRMSMASLAAIQPGTVLPVAVARSVPLKIGGRTIATGSVGTADDCVAIRITKSFA